MERSGLSAREIAKIVLTAIAIVGALYFVYLIREIVTLLLISVFLAIALTPLVNLLDRGRFPRWAAILTVYFAIVLGIFGIGLAVVPPVVNGVNDLVDNLPGYVEDLRDNETFRKYDEKYDIVDSLQKEANKLPSRIGDAAGTLRDVTVGVFTKAVQLLTVLVITFILILDGRRLAEWFFRQLDAQGEARARKVVAEINRAVVGYVVGNLLISVVAGVITWITLEILGIPFAVPLAVLMALFDLVPLVGATLGGIIIGIVCAIVDFPTAPIVWVAVLLLYQQLENHLIQPVIYGRTVQLHPLLVIVAILIGGTLLGVLGALLAIPAAAVIQILVRDWWEHRPRAGQPAFAAEGPGGAPLPPPD
jgi:predicted PurR-regulated permease PerM